METVYKGIAAAMGAVISVFAGVPAMMWVLIGVMTLDYITGLMTGAMGVSDKTEGGRLSSRAAYEGLLRKVMVLVVVLLAVFLDLAVQVGAGVSFSAVTGATCLWFVASEGVSVLENAALMGLPIPQVLIRALEIMKNADEDDKAAQ